MIFIVKCTDLILKISTLTHVRLEEYICYDTRTYLKGPGGMRSLISISHQQSDPFSRNKAEGILNKKRKEKIGRELGCYRIKGDKGRGG